MRIDAFQRRGGREETDRRIDRDGEAERGEPLRGDDRRPAALHHVGEQRRIDLLPDALQFVLAFRTLHEDDVGTGLGVELAAPDRLVEAERRPRVGARDHQKIVALPGFDRDLDLEHHLVGGNDAAAGRVAALLRQFLILDLDRRDAGRLVAAHGLAHVQETAVAGVRICDQRRLDGLRHLTEARNHVAVGGDADVRHAQIRRDGAESGGVERIEAETVGDLRRDQVEDAGRNDKPALSQGRPQP